MEKEFVSYELSKRLYLLGYNERNIYHYCNGLLQEGITYNSDGIHRPYESVSAPLYQQAFRWFREKYRLHTYIEGAYPWFRYYINSEDNTWEGFKHLKYEEAELACLDKLIEIVESKS